MFGGRFSFSVPGFGNVRVDDRSFGFRGQGMSGSVPLRGLFGHGGGYDRGYEYGQGELVGPYPNEAMARAYGRAQGARPWMQRAREDFYGEGVVRENPRYRQAPAYERGYYAPQRDDYVPAPQQRSGEPMDIRPPAQRQAEAAPQPQRPAAVEPTAEQLRTLEQTLCRLPRAQVVAMQTQLDRAGFGASRNAEKYSKVDGIAGPLTARGFFDYAQSRGLNPMDVQASLRALQRDTAQAPIRGGQHVAGMDDVRSTAARNGDAAIRLAEMRDAGR